jgi:hypothetical protein
VGKLIEQKNYFSFVAGLNTESSHLTSPPNTWRDGYNVIPQINGELHRRRGIEFESDYVLSSTVGLTTAETLAHTTNEWNSVAGDGARNFIVVQRGATVYFYDNFGGNVSATEKAFTINLATYLVASNPNAAGDAPISAVSGNGYLIIVSSDITPLLVTYNTATEDITVEALTIYIRDFDGVDDSLAVDTRPGSLSTLHNYNLLNQGWTAANITAYFTAIALYPSNAQIWTAGKNSSDIFTPSLLDLQYFGNTPAPKGKFILDIFNKDRDAASGLSGITDETTVYRPTTVAFFAGRAWYAGTKASSLSSLVLFSQVAENSTKFGYCYQEADPTSEYISDLVATDGGVIAIPEIGTILKLLPLGNSMLVLADNGVWQIIASDTGFSADSYSVHKISSVGCLSASSVVEVENTAMYWGTGGIYMFTQESTVSNMATGAYTVAAVTDMTIKSFYTSIPISNRSFASGKYNQEERIIYWAYNDDALFDGFNNRFRKNTLLCFDVRLKAFFLHSIEALSAMSPYVLDVFITKGNFSSQTQYDVLAGADDVDSVEPFDVIARLDSDSLTTINIKITKFLVESMQAADSFKYTVAELDNDREAGTRYRDWFTADGVGAAVVPYIITGFELTNLAGSRQLQGVYCLAYCKKTEEGTDSSDNIINTSSVLLQARWDWTDSVTAGRWTTEQQAYRHKRTILLDTGPVDGYDTGYGLVVTKNKIRGYGRAVQFKWSGEEDKDFKLSGWAVLYLAEENI